MSSLMSFSRFCGGNVKPAASSPGHDRRSRRAVHRRRRLARRQDDRHLRQAGLAAPLGLAARQRPRRRLRRHRRLAPDHRVAPGAECYILSGAAFSIDDELKADSDGRGITGTTTGDIVGAIALEAATAANQLIKVVVRERRVV